MIAPYGQTRSQFGGYGFRSPEALMKEFSIMQLKPFWRGTKFKEVSISELAEMSRERADQYYAKQERRNEDRKIGYMLPSQYAAKVENEWRPDMKGRGIESLVPSDRELVSKAETGTEGSVFQALFRGDRVTGEWAADVNSIMRRLALYTDDAEQIGRVFRRAVSSARGCSKRRSNSSPPLRLIPSRRSSRRSYRREMKSNIMEVAKIRLQSNEFCFEKSDLRNGPKIGALPRFWGQDKAVGPNPPRGLVTSARQDKRETRFP